MRGRSFLIGLLALALIVSLAPYVSADAPPHLQINTPDNGATVSGTVVISGNAWDDVGIGGVKVSIDRGEWVPAIDTSGNDTWWSWALEWDTTTVPDGWHGIAAITWDTSNQHADAGIEVLVKNEPTPDNRPPSVAILEPPNRSTVRGVVTVVGKAWDEDQNDTVELVQVQIDHGEWQNATPTGDNSSWNHWAFEWNTTEVDDGWHAFAARAWDGDAYSEPVVFEYFVDNVQGENRPPVANIEDPKPEQVVWGIVLVHGTSEDPDDGDRVELVQVRIGDGEWVAAKDTSRDDTWRTWAYQWDTTTRDNGVVHVCARAWDGDLYGEPSCRVVKVHNEYENQRPKVQITHPYNGQTVKGVFLIHGKAWDDHGVEVVQIRFNDGEWTRTTDTSPDGSWTTWAYEWHTQRRDDGCLHLSARAWDGSLFSEVHTIKVCVDNVNNPPRVEIVHPENGETVHGRILVHGVADDDHGVKLVQVRIDGGEWHKATDTGREKPWTTWAFEWDTRQYDNGEHKVCARAWDGEKHSELSCVVVIVENDHRDGYSPAPGLGGATPFLAAFLLGGAGVAMLMWLRKHGYLR